MFQREIGKTFTKLYKRFPLSEVRHFSLPRTARKGDHINKVPVFHYPGPRGLLLFFIGKFCDANRFFYFFVGTKRWEPRKESLWSRPLGISLSCHQLLTVVSDWRIFLIALRVIWLDGLNIFGDGSGVSMLTFMDRCRELLLYQRIFSPGKGKIFVVVNCKFRRSW